MAAIDKMYGTPEDWEAMKAWFRTNADDLLRYMYDRPTGRGPLSNFPSHVDRWLWAQEDLPDFMREQLIFQYGPKGPSAHTRS